MNKRRRYKAKRRRANRELADQALDALWASMVREMARQLLERRIDWTQPYLNHARRLP